MSPVPESGVHILDPETPERVRERVGRSMFSERAGREGWVARCFCRQHSPLCPSEGDALDWFEMHVARMDGVRAELEEDGA